VLGILFGPKKDEVIGGWRKHHDEGFHFHFLPNFNKVIVSRWMRWAERIARMGRYEGHIKKLVRTEGKKAL
jgi:hypothetical protein